MTRNEQWYATNSEHHRKQKVTRCRITVSGSGPYLVSAIVIEGTRTGEKSWSRRSFEHHGRDGGAGGEEIVLMIKEVIEYLVLLLLHSWGRDLFLPVTRCCRPCRRNKLFCRCLDIYTLLNEIFPLIIYSRRLILNANLGSLFPTPSYLPAASDPVSNTKLSVGEIGSLIFLPKVSLPRSQIRFHPRPSSGSAELWRAVERIVAAVVPDTVIDVVDAVGQHDLVLPQPVLERLGRAGRGQNLLLGSGVLLQLVAVAGGQLGGHIRIIRQ